MRLPWPTAAVDVTVSGLVLNFVRDHESMVREMRTATRAGGCVAAYVWDYAGGMQMMRHFWDAALTVSPGDARLDQAERFPLCRPEPLRALFEKTELSSVTVRALDVPTTFASFDDYWRPFLGRTGAAVEHTYRNADGPNHTVRLIIDLADGTTLAEETREEGSTALRHYTVVNEAGFTAEVPPTA